MNRTTFDKETQTYKREIEDPKLVIVEYSVSVFVRIEMNGKIYEPFDKELSAIIGKNNPIHQRAEKYEQILAKALDE